MRARIGSAPSAVVGHGGMHDDKACLGSEDGLARAARDGKQQESSQHSEMGHCPHDGPGESRSRNTVSAGNCMFRPLASTFRYTLLAAPKIDNPMPTGGAT